jgi:anti-sigma regulatory factor (Ser/Thr protein kinase)
MQQTTLLPVMEESNVGEVRRKAASLAAYLKFTDERAGRLAIISTELAGNIAKHARSGEILLLVLDEPGRSGVEILALDKGPGIGNVAASMRDGYSTAGTPGTGLGAASRLSDVFDIQSTPGVGTAVLARVWAESAPRARESGPTQHGVVCIAKPREEVCGDAWGVVPQEHGALFAVVDGLGHGPDAGIASNTAIGAMAANSSAEPLALLGSMHLALRSTRGAAGAVAKLDMGANEIKFAGVGNIGGALTDGATLRHMVSHNGTLGHGSPHMTRFAYPLSRQAVIVMHSDGLATQWRTDRYPGLLTRHPALIAGVLYRDFRRGTDDVTVLVVRQHDRA